MDLSSDELSSSDEEIDLLAEITSKNMAKDFEENMDTDSSDESDSSDENVDDSEETQNTSKNNDSDLFVIDKKPLTTKKGSKGRNLNDKNLQLASKIGDDMKLPGIYINVNPYQNANMKTEEFCNLQKNRSQADLKVMEKSVLTPEFEKQDTIPKYQESVRKLKRERQKLREMTKGKKWFDLPKTDLTEEKKHSFRVLQMRKAIDPKRFYKSNDSSLFPKYCQFGTIVESAADFYSARVPKKQRKQTIVDELLADAEFRTYNKKKFEEIQKSMQRGTGAYQDTKILMHRKKGGSSHPKHKKQKKFFIDSSAFAKRPRR